MSKIFVALFGLFVLGNFASAAEVEYRDYRVTVNGKPAGEFRLTTTRLQDGTVIFACQADVKVAMGLSNYGYSYRGSESWHNGRLVRLDSTTDDNGKKYTVNGMADVMSFKVRVNNEERMLPAEIITTSLWQLPLPKYRNKYGLFLEADHGKDLNCYLQFVDSRPMDVLGTKMTCTHHHLTGSLDIRTFHDPQGSLVRLESIENGQHIVIDLFKVRK